MISAKRLVLMAMSGMTSAAFSAILALPDRPVANATLAAQAADHGPAAKAAAAAPYCYHPSNRFLVTAGTEVADDDYGTAYETPAMWVPRSPCHDINVRAPYNAAGSALGQPVCVPLKVIVAGHDAVGWVDTCTAWVVLAKFVTEGKPFVIRAALRPVEVTVAA
jgi:hypothetical protein